MVNKEAFRKLAKRLRKDLYDQSDPRYCLLGEAAYMSRKKKNTSRESATRYSFHEGKKALGLTLEQANNLFPLNGSTWPKGYRPLGGSPSVELARELCRAIADGKVDLEDSDLAKEHIWRP